MGGAICDQFATVNVTNSYFVGNQAVGGNSATGVGGPAGGGGIAGAGFATTNLTNVIFEGNVAKGGTAARVQSAAAVWAVVSTMELTQPRRSPPAFSSVIGPWAVPAAWEPRGASARAVPSRMAAASAIWCSWPITSVPTQAR